MDAPNCKCHNEPMRWAKDSAKKAGGRWRCRIKNREQVKKWHREHSDEWNAYQREYRARQKAATC